jgi:hypothetical protein
MAREVAFGADEGFEALIRQLTDAPTLASAM